MLCEENLIIQPWAEKIQTISKCIGVRVCALFTDPKIEWLISKILVATQAAPKVDERHLFWKKTTNK